MQSKPRKFRGFVALERQDGPLIWGTFRTTRAEARAVYDRWNPGVEGALSGGAIVPVEITILDN